MKWRKATAEQRCRINSKDFGRRPAADYNQALKINPNAADTYKKRGKG